MARHDRAYGVHHTKSQKRGKSQRRGEKLSNGKGRGKSSSYRDKGEKRG